MNSVKFLTVFAVFLLLDLSAGTNMKRDRGVSFYNCLNSNTSSHGNIWITASVTGHVWDNSSKSMDSNVTVNKEKWLSNVRGFPELETHLGLFNIGTFFIESRVVSYGFKPGWISTGLKLTIPNNQELRLHGAGLLLKYTYQFSESNPSLGGYSGFMPEGFVVKGHNMEIKMLYEFDLISRMSSFPLRVLFNGGVRVPFAKERLNRTQIVANTGFVYSGYRYDFYVLYSLESFWNFFNPAIIDGAGKKIAVYFSENPMYLTLGGDVRYENGMTLSLSIPLLLSVNQQSKMSVEDLIELHRKTNPALFADEKKRGIVDPFDPWFVKWKIVGSVTFPLRFRTSSAEMMRNYLMLKNRKDVQKIDIDQKILNDKNSNDEYNNQTKEDRIRLEEINRRRSELNN
ncbi:MAG: hypothetical protein GX640_07600 [Fibrobacter sp.]|nr:hypothetical protein [Fibrobacter sp.]